MKPRNACELIDEYFPNSKRPPEPPPDVNTPWRLLSQLAPWEYVLYPKRVGEQRRSVPNKKFMIISGATNRTTESIATRLISKGHEVIHVNLTQDHAEAGAAGEKLGRFVNSPKSIHGSTQELADDLNGLDTIICIIGVVETADIESCTFEMAYSRLLNETQAALQLVGAAMTGMHHRGRGQIFFISSLTRLKIPIASMNFGFARDNTLEGCMRTMLKPLYFSKAISLALVEPSAPMPDLAGFYKDRPSIQKPFATGNDEFLSSNSELLQLVLDPDQVATKIVEIASGERTRGQIRIGNIAKNKGWLRRTLYKRSKALNPIRLVKNLK